MSIQWEESAPAGGSTHDAVSLTPQARRLLEGPVLPTLLRLAAPTVGLMLLQGVIAAGEAAFVGRLGSHALAGVSLSFPLVMLFTSEPAVAGHGMSYLVRVGPAYAFLGLGLALFFAAQGRRRTTQPLLATLTRLLVAGALGSLGLRVFGWGIESLFALMACGLVLYGLVMVAVMRRELGFYAGGR